MCACSSLHSHDGFVFVLLGGEQGWAEGGEQVSDPYLPSRAICLGREDKSKECVGFPVSKLSLLSNQKKKKKKSRFNQPQCPGRGGSGSTGGNLSIAVFVLSPGAREGRQLLPSSAPAGCPPPPMPLPPLIPCVVSRIPRPRAPQSLETEAGALLASPA